MDDFLAVSDLSAAEVQDLLDVAVRLKKEYFDRGNRPLLQGKVLGMIFQKPSLRTRVSFDMAMRHMGGDALYLSPSEIGLGQRESIADVARVFQGTSMPSWHVCSRTSMYSNSRNGHRFRWSTA